jgi:hypothetical protein
MKRLLCLTCLSASLALGNADAAWTLTEAANPLGPGKAVDVKRDGKLVARLVHGEGQMKPYLHVFGEEGELLTNSGLDASGKPVGLFPHHRGLFIGWNRMASDLGGPFDLWHLNNGGKMELVKLEKLDANADAATIVATIEWRGGKKDANGSDLLLTETRTLVLARPEGKRTQIDARFALRAARELTLGGDLQHAGVHFRAGNEVAERKAQTSYLWEPDLPGPGGKAASKDLKWCRLLFPMGPHWYTALQLNPPANPVEELSWRDYGRFGFFSKQSLKKNETRTLDYRFIIERVEPPGDKSKQSPEQIAASRAACQAQYDAYVKALAQ